MKLDRATLTALRDAGREIAMCTSAVLTDLPEDSYRERIEKAARRIAELAGLVPTDVAEKFDVDTQDLDPEDTP